MTINLDEIKANLIAGLYEPADVIVKLVNEVERLQTQAEGLKANAAESLIKFADRSAKVERLEIEVERLQAENATLIERVESLQVQLRNAQRAQREANSRFYSGD